MSEDNERSIIACLNSIEAILVLHKNKVKAEDFVFHREKLEFVLDYVKQYKLPPTSSVLMEKFEDYIAKGPDSESFQYYIDTLKNDALERNVRITISKDLELLKTNPKQALRHLNEEFGKLLSVEDHGVSHTDRDAEKRLEWYEEKKALRAKGLISGIPTGLKYFNDKREGFQYGNLVTITGISWVGKSWMLLYMGIKAFQAGNKVLIVSCEMTSDEQELRFDTLMAHAKGYDINFQDLRNGGGNLGADYKQYLAELSQTDQLITIDASDIENLEASEIATFVDMYKPDVVLIDGMEMLQDKMAKNRSGWEEAKLVVSQAKMLATSRNILVIATAQAGRQASDRMPRPKDVAYSFDVYRASDYMIAMARNQEGESDDDGTRAYTIVKERNGSGHTKRLKLEFDPTHGIIMDIE